MPVGEFGDDGWGAAEGAFRDDIDLDLDLDAVVEGILVRGTVGADLQLPCGRCLVPQDVRVDSDVAELFVDPAKREDDDEDDPGYELIDDRTAIDLSVMVRDALLIDLPVRVLCREDCQGLCEECGADRNLGDCGHRPDEAPDPRWAKLADLDLPSE
ncbi:MAG: DUF177 domain-containing protein [Actinobacteria bacterium]|nr:DUF177 domain-containing protein [Actinomycetota bacterium]